MNRRTLFVLAAIAVVAAVLAVVGQRADRSSGSGGGLVGTPLVADLATTLATADTVEVITAGGEPAVTLERDGDTWTIAQQDGYPADFARLREALTALAEASVVEEKTSNPDFYDRLAVEPVELDSAAGTGVRILAADRTLASVILGGESGASGRFARASDAETSVLIDRNPEFPADPTQWLAPGIIDIRSDRVQRVEIEHADGERLVIARPTRDETNFAVEAVPEDRELQYASVANVTGNALRELQLEGARATADDAAAATTSTFHMFDGLVVTVTGVELDGEQWIALDAAYDAAQAERFATGDSAESDAGAAEVTAEADAINERVSDWYFRVPSHVYGQMTRRMDDLLKAPAEAAAED